MLERPPSTFIKNEKLPALIDSAGTGSMGRESSGSEFTAGQSFYAPLQDAGAGVVSTVATGTGASQAATFTRATTATTVLSNGLIGSVGTNVPRSYYDPSSTLNNRFVYSEDFQASGWGITAGLPSGVSSFISTSRISPVGSSNATDWVPGGATPSTAVVEQVITSVAGMTYTWSIYFSTESTLDNFFLQMTWNGGPFGTDRSVGTVTIQTQATTPSATGGATAPTMSVTHVGGTWYRLACTAVASQSGSSSFVIRCTSGSANGVKFARIWGAQFEERSSAGGYVNTQNAAESVSKYLGYLAEGARTNLCLQSEDLSTTWANSNSTESVNTITAPDGTTTADTLIEDATAGVPHALNQSINFTTGLSYTFSVFAKAKERTWLALLLPTSAFGSTSSVFFNLANGTIGTQTANDSAKITAYPNGWYRCEITDTATATAAGTPTIRLATADTVDTYNGDGTSGLYLWGAQVEQGAFASSYIPTTTLAVTRNVDKLSYPTAGNIFNAQGTAYAEFASRNNSAGNSRIIGGANETPLAFSGSTGTTIFDGTNARNSNADATMLNGAIHKVASSWNTNRLAISLSGTTTLTAATYDGTISTGGIIIGNDNSDVLPVNGTVKNVRIWGNQLTDYQLQDLTS